MNSTGIAVATPNQPTRTEGLGQRFQSSLSHFMGLQDRLEMAVIRLAGAQPEPAPLASTNKVEPQSALGKLDAMTDTFTTFVDKLDRTVRRLEEI